MKHLDNVHWCEKCDFFEFFKDDVCIECGSHFDIEFFMNKKDATPYIEAIASIPSVSTKTELVNDEMQSKFLETIYHAMTITGE